MVLQLLGTAGAGSDVRNGGFMRFIAAIVLYCMGVQYVQIEQDQARLADKTTKPALGGSVEREGRYLVTAMNVPKQIRAATNSRIPKVF